MNIEESIEYLKLKIKNDNLTIQGMFGDIYEEIQKDNTAIETLLTAYEKEKEKNKKINKYIEDRTKIDKDIQTFINKDYVEQEYISKDKVKAIIEELNKDFKEYENGQEWEIQDEIRGQIEVLQSLLEKE